jgi:hypothetical protein
MELHNYNFVLARFDRDPDLIFQAYFYEESPQSQRIELDGKAGIAIGVNSAFSQQRAVIEGWTDVTEQVKKASDKPQISPDAGAEEDSQAISIKEEAPKAKPRKKAASKRRK